MRISDWSSDVCSSDLHVLEEEVLDGLVEAIDRQRADAREIPFGGDVELIRDRWFQIRIAAGGGELKRVAVEARLEVIPAIGERRPRQRPRSGEAEQEIVGQVELEVQARREIMEGIGRTDRLRDRKRPSPNTWH